MPAYQTQTYAVRFSTPAFLGNALQQGQWRVPPFKALLRHWWRIIAAPDFNYRYQELQKKEIELFGHAGTGKETRKSRVILKLSHWQLGQQKGIGQGRPISNEGFDLDPRLYLGYGPINQMQAISPQESAVLRLRFPQEAEKQIKQALQLIHLYGSLGGRSRNAWGSVQLEKIDEPKTIRPFLRDWQDCLNKEWAHAIGRDQKGALIWRTGFAKSGLDVIDQLGEIRFNIAKLFPFTGIPPHPKPQPRHWLNYPVTKHSVAIWKRDFRLPNSLRFKVRFNPDLQQYQGLIIHLPCKPPLERVDISEIRRTWQKVHRYLDQELERSVK